MTTWRDRALKEALSWDRTPYHHAARLKGVGVDCAMLLSEVYEAACLIPRVVPEDYPMDWANHRDEERIKEWVERFAVPLPDGALPQPADLVLYRFGRCYSHAGIVVAWPNIIHAVRRIGMVVIEDGDQGDYDAAVRPRLFYTFNEVT